MGKAVLGSQGHPGMGHVAAAPSLVSPSAWRQVVAAIWGSSGVECGEGSPCIAAFVADLGGVGGSAVTAEGAPGCHAVPRPFTLTSPRVRGAAPDPLRPPAPEHPRNSSRGSQREPVPAVPSPGPCARSEPSIRHLRVPVTLLPPGPSPQADSLRTSQPSRQFSIPSIPPSLPENPGRGHPGGSRGLGAPESHPKRGKTRQGTPLERTGGFRGADEGGGPAPGGVREEREDPKARESSPWSRDFKGTSKAAK